MARPLLQIRFHEAFNAELQEHPGIPPGPTALNRRLGLHGRSNNLNGRYTKLRSEHLLRAGFRKDDAANRWRLDPESQGSES